MTRILAEPAAWSSLIIGLFGAYSTSCWEGDHRILLDAIGARDADHAAN